jgi:hypothetical protein
MVVFCWSGILAERSSASTGSEWKEKDHVIEVLIAGCSSRALFCILNSESLASRSNLLTMKAQITAGSLGLQKITQSIHELPNTPEESKSEGGDPPWEFTAKCDRCVFG